MDADDFLKLQATCENVMNVVVESRKAFGKMCQEYEQKTALLNDKMINQQLETISNYKFKSKNPIPDLDLESMRKDADDFGCDSLNLQKRTEDLTKTIQDLKKIILQIKNDEIVRKLREPLTGIDK